LCLRIKILYVYCTMFNGLAHTKISKMTTLETTTRQENGNKAFYVVAHNLQSCTYSLTLLSRASTASCYTPKFKGFESLEEAIEMGKEYLKSSFTGIFANKSFLRSLK
jgi:hypothetical protein